MKINFPPCPEGRDFRIEFAVRTVDADNSCGFCKLMYLSQFIGEKMIALVLSVEKRLRHTTSNGSE